MVEEGKKVDGTGNKPIIDPETGEVKVVEKEKTDEEVAAEAAAAAEEKPEEETWEKRYKDLQSQKDREVSDVQKDLDRHKNLVAPFNKNVKRNEDGSLVFDFSDTSPEGKETKLPEKATEEEWINNPQKASEKDWAYRDYLRRKEDAAQTNATAGTQAVEEYRRVRNKDWDEVQEEFPDMKDKDSELSKRATALLKADPSIEASPFCNRICVKLAASELGVKPTEQEASPGKKKDASYIIGPGGGGGGKGKGGKLTEAEFANLSSEAQREYMEKDHEKKTEG